MNALIIIDVQNDFLPGGALAVPRGDEIIPLLNRLQGHFELVVATQDWHPKNHSSFASAHRGKKPLETIELDGCEQVLWPEHCVQGSRGAQLAEALDCRRVQAIIRKGTDPDIDSYSAFYDNLHRRTTGLGGFLKDHGVDCVVITGLAGEYCVRYTALDARQLGFQTVLLTDATRPISSQDFEYAVGNLRNYGVLVTESAKFLKN
ncbi:MAG: bifunctional nicotinamidase/pyrazinamidase [Planctomycetes bacterium]|nr:bifunctional nicotinamidase/pyrazinamidase [Planctomycetota bacterium]